MKMKALICLALATCYAGSVTAAEVSTVVDVNVVRDGKQYTGGRMFVQDGQTATTGAYSEYPMEHSHLDGTPLSESEAKAAKLGDFAGSWQLEIKRIGFDANGNALIVASLDEHAPGAEPVHQDVSISIKAGEHVASIHGANGSDYLLTIKHLVDPVG